MRFYTDGECEEWCRRLEVPLDEKQRPHRAPERAHRLRCGFPPTFPQLLWFSRCLESALQPRRTCLLWVTQSGVWPSSENLHVYYRLRQSYGDLRLLDEAPGHFCLGFEQAEVVSIIHLCVLFGWDVHLLPTSGYAQASISHDEGATVAFDDKSQLDKTRHALERAKVKILPS